MKVTTVENDGVYTIKLIGTNAYTLQQNQIKFIFNMKTRSSIKYAPTPEEMSAIVYNVISQFKPEAIFGRTAHEKSTKLGNGAIRKLVTASVRNLTNRKTGREDIKELLDKYEATGDTNIPLSQAGKDTSIPFVKEAKQPSIFEQDPSTAKTCMIWGRSYTGKTTLLVSELNKLTKIEDPDRKPKFIILMTESKNSQPLKDLDPSLNVMIVDRWCPNILKFFTSLNKITTNKFRTLIICDDVISGIRNTNFSKMLLTLRNNGISSCVLLQRPQIVDPNSRNNVHKILITNLHKSDWAKIIPDFMIDHLRDAFRDPTIKITPLANKTYNLMKNCTMVYDQVTDKMFFMK